MARQVSELWIPTQAGVLIPAGNALETSARKTTNFLHVKDRAKEIQELYASAGLTMPPSCGLATLIENAKLLSDRWFTNQTTDDSMIDVFYALHLDRIAGAILSLRDVPGKEKYLNDLTSGELDFFKRESSYAKNIFWELELWSTLRRSCSSAFLQDPPDIVLDLRGGRLGISCKKLYSENNVEKVLSEAVSQVEDDFDVGVVAINLDDLTPPDTVLHAKNKTDMDRILGERTAEFLKCHERHFRKYLSSGRLVSVLVSVSVIAEVLDWKVRFNNASQSMAWTIPGLIPEKEALLEQFRDIAVASIEAA